LFGIADEFGIFLPLFNDYLFFVFHSLQLPLQIGDPIPVVFDPFPGVLCYGPLTALQSAGAVNGRPDRLGVTVLAVGPVVDVLGVSVR